MRSNGWVQLRWMSQKFIQELALLVGVGALGEEFLELVDDQQQVFGFRMLFQNAFNDVESGNSPAFMARASFSTSSRRSASLSESSSKGSRAAARAWKGFPPGRIDTTNQSPSSSNWGNSPAKTAEDLPEPEGPTITATRSCWRTDETSCSVKSSRPKKKGASAWRKAARPR